MLRFAVNFDFAFASSFLAASGMIASSSPLLGDTNPSQVVCYTYLYCSTDRPGETRRVPARCCRTQDLILLLECNVASMRQMKVRQKMQLLWVFPLLLLHPLMMRTTAGAAAAATFPGETKQQVKAPAAAPAEVDSSLISSCARSIITIITDTNNQPSCEERREEAPPPADAGL